jgi:threonine synthase
MAFKDVGARFMSRCLGYFNKDKVNSKNGFGCHFRYGRRCEWFPRDKGVEVIILYPSGKVSDIQERQLLWDKILKALKVEGVF